MKREDALALIDLERERQIGKGYAAEFDGRRTIGDWAALVRIQLGAHRPGRVSHRATFVRAAAVCIAALEALPGPEALKPQNTQNHTEGGPTNPQPPIPHEPGPRDCGAPNPKAAA